MGAFDWFGQSIDWVKNRWSEDWADVGKTFTESWSDIPNSGWDVLKNSWGMISAPFKDDGDFWGAGKAMLDSSVKMGSDVLGGTLGTLFQIPILHEASWLLDKAYRYGIARPVSTSLLWITNSQLDAYNQGKFGDTDLLNQMFQWNSVRKAWNDSQYVTPGQAIAYSGFGLLHDEGDDLYQYLKENDPRTKTGQAKFNGPDAGFWFKYTSGTLDMGANIIADPGHGLSLGYKASKLALVDKVANAKYIRSGGVEAELGKSSFSKVYKLAATKGMTGEKFRDLTMPDAINGGRMSAILVAAANLTDNPIFNKKVFSDAYLMTRAFDPEAFQRVGQVAPQIAEAFANQYAKFSIADWDTTRGKLASETGGADALRQTALDAFIDSFAGGEGLWGSALGIGVLEKMPRVRQISKLRYGVHQKILYGMPVIVGRPFANLMPSQGWTPKIDPMDGTGIGLRQFKANLERSRDLTPEEIEKEVSAYGAATSDATRHTIAMRVEDRILDRILGRHGIARDDFRTVLKELNRWRAGQRKMWGYERRFVSEEAARRAEKAVENHQLEAAAYMQRISEDFKKSADAGDSPDGFVSSRDVDGALNIQQIPINRGEPLLRSQFTDAISMLDYRALNGALRWWKWTHPDPKAPLWRTALGDLAKTRGLYEVALGAADAASVLWKATALMRPAQAPRNLADDILRTYLEFGKLNLLMTASDALPNLWRNWMPGRGRDGRLKLTWDAVRDRYGKKPDIPAEVDHEAPGNLDVTDPKDPVYLNPQWAFANGLISLQAYVNIISAQYGKKPPNVSKPGTPTFEEPIVEQTAPPVPKQKTKPSEPTEEDLKAKPNPFGAPVQPMFGPREPEVPSVPPERQVELDEFGHPIPRSGVPQPAPKVEPLKPFKSSLSPEQLQRMADERADELGEARQTLGKSVLGTAAGLGGAKQKRKQVPLEERPGYNKFFTPNFTAPAHLVEKSLFERHSQDPTYTADMFKQDLALAAITRAGKNVFMKRNWANAIMKRLYTQHLSRRESELYLDDPYAPSTMVLDPFLGTMPKEAPKDLRDVYDMSTVAEIQTRNVPKKKRGSIQSIAQGDAAVQMKSFITYHMDELLRPDTLLALRVKPNGNLAIGFAKVKKEALDSGFTAKASAAQRLRDFGYNEIKDVAHTGFTAVLPNGQRIAFGGVFDGPAGQALQRRVSARTNPSVAYGNIVDVDIENLVNEQGSWARPLEYYDDDYAANWERAVNAQLASDPVARMFIEGKSDTQVIDAVESSRWGTKWVRAMSFRGISYVDQIRQIEAMVNTYLPHPDPIQDGRYSVDSAAAESLRKAALDKQARYNGTKLDSGAVIPGMKQALTDVTEHPQIHGLSVDHLMGNSRAWKYMRDFVRGAQKVISDMPVDKVARFPFMAMSYKKYGTELAKIANEYYEGGVPAHVIDHIKEAARERAYHDTRYRLYDTAQRNDFANATRLLMPFSAAMMDSYIKYGRRIRENPMLLVQGAYYWNMFERNGMVQDENGNVASEEDGRTVWYRIDPETGERTPVPREKVGEQRFVQFQLPSQLAHVVGRNLYGVDAKPVFAVNKDTMNVFLNLPTGGPLVAFPANEFALSQPEMADEYLIKKFLLPFGPSHARGVTFLPSTVRSLWDIFNAQDGDTASGHAAGIMQAEMIGYGLGTRNEPPTFSEVREKAGAMKAMRFLATFVSPASFQVVSPYQPYVDAYRQLIQDDPTTAHDKFMSRYGDEFYAVALNVTRNNAGLSATIKSQEAYNKYKALVDQYPEFGGLIVGSEGSGEFSKAVYEAQKGIPLRPGSSETLRTMMSLEESVDDLQKKTIWAKYSKMMDLIQSSMVDRGISSLRSRAARDLVQARDAFVEANRMWTDPATGKETLSPWYLDYKNTDQGTIERKFEALYTIASDPELRKREEIRGLIDYLQAREQMQSVMQRYGVKTLVSDKAKALRNQWDSKVHDLTESNVQFKAVWNRWLSNDSALDFPAVGG